MLGGLAAGALIASTLLGGADVGLLDVARIGLGIALLLLILRRRRTAPARPTPAAVAVAAPVNPDVASSGGSALARGVRDIRRTDPGFDPARFVGWVGMVFRATQAAWATRDITAVRDRLTPEMFRELHARCDQLQRSGRAARAEQIEIQAAVTEAWQEGSRDYVTAHVGGSMVDYTVDEVAGGLVDGSRTIPTAVDEFWTFTRPAGLHSWMLAAIQTS
jgi:predicted lipid-binding transport protein (Tim44 family)